MFTIENIIYIRCMINFDEFDIEERDYPVMPFRFEDMKNNVVNIFRTGDRLLIGCNIRHTKVVDSVTVVHVGNDYLYIKFDNFDRGNNCSGLAMYGHCWTFTITNDCSLVIIEQL